MKQIYDFAFFCIYWMVPKKSMYGQRNAAVVLISLVDCAVATSIYFLSLIFLNRLITKPLSFLIIITIVVTSFVFNSKYFEKRTKFKEILSAYEPGSLSHKFIGAGMLLGTFAGYILVIIFVDRYIAAHP